MNNVQKSAFNKFLSEVGKLKDAENLKSGLSNEFSNVILLSGEVLGEDTYGRIREIGKKNGFETLTDGLSVMYRSPKSTFRVE
ncbi:hypothetical protein KJ966_12540 [bacterium]|nr:hypothetical protein [bacterium]